MDMKLSDWEVKLTETFHWAIQAYSNAQYHFPA